VKDVGRESLLDRIQQHATPFGMTDSQHGCDTYFQKQYGMVQAKCVFKKSL